jgi:prepilin-type N-terminal cleavage/methylation domain-containing protein
MLTALAPCGRRGFTLIELLLSVAMFGMLAGAVMQIAVRQQRFYGNVRALVRARRSLRDGVDLLRHDLRAISPSAGGLSVIAPDAVEFRAPVGTSVICDVDPSRVLLRVPEPRPGAATLTDWSVPPAAGDTVLVYEHADHPDSARWSPYALVAAPSAASPCPAGSSAVDSRREGGGAIVLHIVPALDPAVDAGAALQIVRWARYQLYRASDGEWYLGFRDCLSTRATPCASLQPVAGPFAAGGLRFVYRDTAGAEVTDPERVARIDVVLRVRRRALVYDASAPAFLVDSLAATIALRNQ